MKSQTVPSRVVSIVSKVFNHNRSTRSSAAEAGWTIVLILICVTLLALFGNGERVSSQTEESLGLKAVLLGGPVNPGGVTGQSLWVKADLGLQVNASQQVEQWLDQSGSGNTTTELRASLPAHTNAIAPTNAILRVANGINFNPAVDFSGAVGRSLKGNAATEWDVSPVSIFAVALPEGGVAGGVASVFDGHANWTTGGSGTAGVGLNVNASGTAYQLDGNGCQTAATTSSINEPRVVRAIYATGTNNLNGSTWLNGVQEATGTNCATVATTFFEVGGRTAGDATFDNRIFNGKITEVVVHKSVLSAANANRVESYLAVKYGITLRQTPAPQNYTASDGATSFWNAATNTVYNNNITGIGRDDASGLSQKQSRSVNLPASGNMVTMGLGTIAADNASNPNAFGADFDFLTWGDDGAVASFNTPITPPVGILATVRTTRIWKVQETGTVGTVKVGIPANLGGGNIVYLVVSDDTTFDINDQYVPLTPLTAGGTTYQAGDFDFTTGQFFAFATLPAIPGGQGANLALWVKANDGLGVDGSDQVQEWFDQSVSGVTTELRAAHPAHTDPIAPSADILRVANGINFNPAVDFSGALGKSLKGNAATEWDVTPVSIFSVALPEGASAPGSLIAGVFDGLANWTTGAGGTAGIGLRINEAGTAYSLDGDGCGTAVTTSSIAEPRVIRGTYANGANGLNGSTWLNGVQEATGGNCATAATTLFEVGGRTAGDPTFDNRIFNGLITEVVVYKSVLPAANANMVESYLAVKYGITLRQTPAPQNYTASDGTVIWDAVLNAVYNDDITGIGRDDVSALNQKQSASVNAGNFLTIGHGIIAADNETNPNDFPADKDFLIWGHDGGSTVFNTPVGTGGIRMERVWKVQENTGVPLAPEAVTNVVVRVPQSIFTGPLPTLVRSTDAVFDGSDTFVPMVANGSDYEATIDFNDGDFFTFVHLSPTAANVSVSGRVLTPRGSGVMSARVVLTDSQGISRMVVTNPFGHFRFDEVQVGETYVVSVFSKGWQFEPLAVSVSDEITGLDIIAQE